MPDAADRFFAAKQRRNIKDMRAVFGANQHDPQRLQQFTGLYGPGRRHFLKVGFQRDGFPDGRKLQLADELDKKQLLGVIPFWSYRIEVDRRRRLEMLFGPPGPIR